MPESYRQFKRLEKPINMQFCIADAYPKKWDMTIIENIGGGGVKFAVPKDMNLVDKVILLQIKIPQLAPRTVELEAKVLSADPRMNSPSADIRAKFINLSDQNRLDLSVIEKMISVQEKKDAKMKK